jgi:hypothetical protein
MEFGLRVEKRARLFAGNAAVASGMMVQAVNDDETSQPATAIVTRARVVGAKGEGRVNFY